ncbi:hypothetical protein BDW62DRAFT_199160 [Aspergillus aurantiobrunneus]
MVRGSSGTENGSSSREYGLAFTIEPPASIRPGVAFSLPVVVAVRPVGTAGSEPLQQLVAGASLRNETGASPVVGLTGNLSSSVRSRVGNTTSGYARFGPLTIANPGRYKLRVMLAANTFSGVTVRGVVESGVIHVHPGAAASQRPTATQISRLQALIPENLDISQADITAWQQA